MTAGEGGDVAIPIPLAPIVEVEGSSIFAVTPSGRVAIEAEKEAQFERDGVTFEVSFGEAAPRVPARSIPGKRAIACVIASALAQAAALGASAFVAPPSSEDASAEQIRTLTLLMEHINEREMEVKEAEQIAEGTADLREAGTGTRAKGEEGAMGNPNTKNAGSRYGVKGPAEHPPPFIARQEALRDANEFGMIGLLNAGAGGDPNAPTTPWGRDDSLGNDPMSARGNMWGVGDGGGGIGLGSIGTLGHGAGTGTGQGFGNGAGRLGGSHRAANNGPQPPPVAYAPPVAAPAPPPDAPIDPNGRFATTYRPGGGHLAAFESAVARGVLPAAANEIVSDVGARFAPVFAVPNGRALGLDAGFERTKLAPNGGAFHVRLALRSTGDHATARPHLSVHLVLDVSGSMAGESITRAREAAMALVDKLDKDDDFSLTTFSSDADVRVTDGPVGPRRAWIKGTISGIGTEGGTNISAGLIKGYEQAMNKSIPEDAVRVVMLVSDGRANGGITSRERLSRLALDAFQKGIQTSSFGLGSDYDGALMSSIAGDGAGGYYYLKAADQIAPALATELDRRLDPVATAVEVRVRLQKDVELLKVYGSRRLGEEESSRVRAIEVAADKQAQKRDKITADRHDDNEGGMRFFIPAFARDEGHALLFKLRAGAGVGQKKLGLVELKYKDRIAKKNVTIELPLDAAFADSDAASAMTIDASIARTVQGFAAGEALVTAARRMADGDRASAIALLAEREAILRTAAGTLKEPLFLRDADRLARMRDLAGGSTSGDPLVLAMLMETAGFSHLR